MRRISVGFELPYSHCLSGKSIHFFSSFSLLYYLPFNNATKTKPHKSCGPQYIRIHASIVHHCVCFFWIFSRISICEMPICTFLCERLDDNAEDKIRRAIIIRLSCAFRLFQMKSFEIYPLCVKSKSTQKYAK